MRKRAKRHYRDERRSARAYYLDAVRQLGGVNEESRAAWVAYKRSTKAAWREFKEGARAEWQSFKSWLAQVCTTEELAQSEIRRRISPLRAALDAALDAAARGLRGGLQDLGVRSFELTVNVTVLEGADPSAVDEDFDFANQVFNPHQIEVKQGSRVDLDADQTQAILGADNQLEFDEQAQSNDKPLPSAEAQQLLAQNRSSGDLTGYWIDAFQPPKTSSLRGLALASFYYDIVEEGVVVATSTRAVDTFAHELGHVLTQEGHVSDPDNLMANGSVRNVGSGQLEDSQLEEIRGSQYMDDIDAEDDAWDDGDSA